MPPPDNTALTEGDRVIAFDKFDWALLGRPKNKKRFWRPATILKIHEPHHAVPETITITWDHKGRRNTSHGHHMENLRREGSHATP